MWSRPERRREFLSVLLGLLALVQVQLAIVVRIDRIEFAVASVVFLVIATAVVAVRRLRDFRFALIAAAYCFLALGLTARLSGQSTLMAESNVNPVVESSEILIGAFAFVGLMFLERRTKRQAPAGSDYAREKELSRRVIDGCSDGVFAVDAEMRFTVWNPAMERLSGMGRDVMLGSLITDSFPFSGEQPGGGGFSQATKGTESVCLGKKFVVPGASREGVFDGYYSPLRNERDQIEGVVGIVRDGSRPLFRP